MHRPPLKMNQIELFHEVDRFRRRQRQPHGIEHQRRQVEVCDDPSRKEPVRSQRAEIAGG